MKEKQEIKEIVGRFDRGYTNTLYGNSFYVKLQKDTDFERLIELVKKLTLTDVSQQRELLLAYNEEINQCMVDSQDILEESDVDEFLANNCS